MAFRLSWLEILLLKLVSRCWLVGRPDSVVGNNVGWELAYTCITIGQGGGHGKETTEGFSWRRRSGWRPGCLYARDDGLTTGYGERGSIR